MYFAYELSGMLTFRQKKGAASPPLLRKESFFPTVHPANDMGGYNSILHLVGGYNSILHLDMRGGRSYAEAARGPGHPEIESNGYDAVRAGGPARQLWEQVREVEEKLAEQQSNTETRKELEKMKVLLR